MGLSNLPPGCTNADIERQCAPGAVEQYEMAHKNEELTPVWPSITPEKAREALDRIYEDDDMLALVECMMAWAEKRGYEECQEAEAEEAAMREYQDEEPPDAGLALIAGE